LGSSGFILDALLVISRAGLEDKRWELAAGRIKYESVDRKDMMIEFTRRRPESHASSLSPGRPGAKFLLALGG
jgi:hypothetical protein